MSRAGLLGHTAVGVGELGSSDDFREPSALPSRADYVQGLLASPKQGGRAPYVSRGGENSTKPGYLGINFILTY